MKILRRKNKKVNKEVKKLTKKTTFPDIRKWIHEATGYDPGSLIITNFDISFEKNPYKVGKLTVTFVCTDNKEALLEHPNVL